MAPGLLTPVLVGLFLAGCTGGSATVATTTTAPTTTVPPGATASTQLPLGEGRELFVYNPEPGQCFDLRATETGERLALRADATRVGDGEVVVLLDCTLPHQYEVTAVLDVPFVTGRPGDDELTTIARRLCPNSHAAYVGLPYERSELEMGWILPTPEEWDRGRTVLACLVFDPDGPTTGTAQGSAR
ncbi:MAG: septum formation family protein [Acidimicrobiales bacterium]|nr:septum formation family protein [Acidimicrobiales bacterium]